MTAPLVTVTSQDGPRITVNDWLKDPLRVPIHVVDMMKQGFLADAVLRPAGTADAGAVQYEESTPAYAPGTVRVRAEGTEVPLIETVGGIPRVVFTEDRSAGVVITFENKRRNQTDKVNQRFTQVRNTMIRTWDDAFLFAVLNNVNVNTMTITTPWNDTDADIRADILGGAKLIEGALDAQGAELGYEMDTLIVNRTTKYDLLASEEFSKENVGDIASENLRYTGILPRKILGFDVLFSPRVPAGKAIGMQRQTAGFIADEVPLNATALYLQQEKKCWRSDVERVSAVGLDQPKALTIFSGVS
jgi:hypothetical protein